MRVLAAAAVALAATTASAEPRRLGPAELYRAARAECGKPGERTAELLRVYVAHWLEPAAFGARVLADWSTLTADQRTRFARVADAKLLAPARSRLAASLCAPRDEYQGVRESASGTTQYRHVMVAHHVGDDTIQIGWVLVADGAGWSLDRIEVPSADYPGIDDDPIDAPTRRQLTDYASAMRVLAP